MPKIKHTARKIPVGLPTARRPYVCPECQKELSDVSNLRRHRIVLHRRNDDGPLRTRQPSLDLRATLAEEPELSRRQ